MKSARTEVSAYVQGHALPAQVAAYWSTSTCVLWQLLGAEREYPCCQAARNISMYSIRSTCYATLHWAPMPWKNTALNVQVAAYRSASTYALWQLRELSGEEACRQAAMRGGAASLLVTLLAYPELAAGAAAALRRLCTTPERGMAVSGAGQSLPLLCCAYEFQVPAGGAMAALRRLFTTPECGVAVPRT